MATVSMAWLNSSMRAVMKSCSASERTSPSFCSPSTSKIVFTSSME